jgi:hypothetical protein
VRIFLLTIEARIKNTENGLFQFSQLTFLLQGSVPTPYIFDDRCDARDAAEQLTKVYNLGKTLLKKKNQEVKGREWALR